MVKGNFILVIRLDAFAVQTSGVGAASVSNPFLRSNHLMVFRILAFHYQPAAPIGSVTCHWFSMVRVSPTGANTVAISSDLGPESAISCPRVCEWIHSSRGRVRARGIVERGRLATRANPIYAHTTSQPNPSRRILSVQRQDYDFSREILPPQPLTKALPLFWRRLRLHNLSFGLVQFCLQISGLGYRVS